MLYTALTYQEAPVSPGIYKVLYVTDQRTYVGATRNLRRRFRNYNKFSSSPQWRLNLCKENTLHKESSLKNVFYMTTFLYEYIILQEFNEDVFNKVLKATEEYYFDLLKPELNRNPPNYPN